MFIIEHDLRVLWVVLVAAGAAGMAAALLLGRPGGRCQPVGGRHGPALGRGRAGSRDPAGAGGLRRPGRSDGRRLPRGAGRARRRARLTSSRLAEAQEQAAAIERSRRELVAWVSHDLRTPLAGIRAMVEALEDGVVTDDPTVSRYHATMRLEADRLAGLVDDLFELSQIQSGTLSLGPGPGGARRAPCRRPRGRGMAARAKGVDLR